jgi:hypothetical protein
MSVSQGVVGISLETIMNVPFCLLNETFLGSVYLYVNVLEQGGRDCGIEWPVFFGGKLAFGGH